MNDLSNVKWTKEDQKNWTKAIKNYYDIEYLISLTPVAKQKILFTTGCSAKKSGKNQGTPSEMYWGQKNLNFYKMMDRFNLDYGVCSDHLGIVFRDEIFDNYDVHPSDINDKIKRNLGEIISKKVLARGYKTILFFNGSPLQSRPYFEMLYYSQLKNYYFTKLDIVESHFSPDQELDLFE